MKNMFTIGQMAKLHNIPIKTLRYYDEINLFKPIEVDPENGYRYYSVEQFKLLDIINYFKVLGMPLKEIKRQTSNRDLNEFIGTLYKYNEITEQKINELQMVKSKIEERIKEMEAVQKIKNIAKPFVQQVAERKVIQLEEEITSIYDLEISLRKLNQHINHFASVFIGKVGLTISKKQLEQESLFDYSSIFLILEEVEKIQFMEDMDFITTLPKGLYASIYFRGGHKNAKDYYEKLVQFIKKENYSVKGDFMIRTIIDQFISSKEEEYLSEIQVLVEER